jgi:hypothetical protein
MGQFLPPHLIGGAAERPLKAAAPSRDRRGREGPILLQKSFCMINREICWL